VHRLTILNAFEYSSPLNLSLILLSRSNMTLSSYSQYPDQQQLTIKKNCIKSKAKLSLYVFCYVKSTLCKFIPLLI